MFDYLCALTALLTLAGAVYAYRKTRDPMHPAIFMAPLFMYFYGVWPLLLNRDSGLQDLFGNAELDYVATLFLFSIACLYIGLLTIPWCLNRRNIFITHYLALSMTPYTRKRILRLSLLLGGLSIAAYAYSLYNVGGFIRAYSVGKGGGYASSGYVGEAVLLSYPAVILFAISRQGRKKILLSDIGLALLLISPNLLQGTFGGRRGPLFLSLSILLLSWYVAKGKQPSLKTILLGVTLISVAVMVVASQRQHFYIGSQGEFDSSKVIESVQPEIVNPYGEVGNEYAMAAATVLAADYYQDYYWGKRYFTTFFIRPIPRQIWPTKYEDMGMDVSALGSDQLQQRYLRVVSFIPLAGSSTGSIADVYVEFSWGVLLVFFLLGRAFALVWKKHRLKGGIWTVLLIEMLALSIYLPTQSFSAWLHRLLYTGIITALLWKYWIKPAQRRPLLAGSRTPADQESHG